MEQLNHRTIRRKEVTTGALLFLIAIQAVLILAAILGSIFYQEKGISLLASDQMRWGYSFCVLLAYVWCMLSWLYVKRTFVNIYFIFLLSLFFTHAGQVLTFTFGLGNDYHTDIYASFSSQLIIKALRYQLLCLLFLQMGAFVAQLFTRPKATDPARYSRDWGKPYHTLYSEKTLSLLKKVVLVITGITIIPLFFTFYQTLRNRVSTNYGDMYLEGDTPSTPFTILFTFCILILLILYFDQVRIRWTIILLGLAFGVCWYLFGTRSGMVAILLGILLVYYYMNGQRLFRRLSVGKVVALIISAIVIMELMSIGQTLRSYTLNELFSPSSNIEWETPYSAFVTLCNEMGTSLITLLYTMTYVPDFVPYMDNYTFNFLVAFIPSPLLHLIGMTEPPIPNLAVWITEMVGSQSGLGYSCLGEAYMAADFYGCTILTFFGAGFVAIENFFIRMWRKGHFIMLACAGFLLSIAFMYARSDFGRLVLNIRMMIYLLIVYLVFYFISTRYLDQRHQLKR